jgi:hypothetical protein
MEIQSGAFIMIGAVMAGFVTATVSLISLIISKEQKITEFRESRRIRMREDVALFLAKIDTLFKLYEADLKVNEKVKFNAKQLAEFRENNKTLLCQLSEMRHRIFLRITPDRSTKLKELLIKIDDEFYGTHAGQKELNDLRDSIIEEVQIILKQEWNRVKEGEPAYQRAELWALASIKISAPILLVLLTLGLYMVVA